MGTRVRCRFCGRRRTIAKHPDEYLRAPTKCGCRGERLARRRANGEGRLRPRTWRVDKYRNTGRETQAVGVCDPVITGCQGYSFPHAVGRGFCDANPDLSDEDRQERHESGSWS